MKKKFLPLETYRAFAALMIAAIHFDVNSPLVNHSFANGYFVHFFFCLSGFVIYFNYQDKIKNFENIKLFIKKRFLRLYPLHLFFLILFLLIEVAKYILLNEYNFSVNSTAFTKNNLKTFFANIFLLQTFLYDYTFNTPSWSISAEFYTYVIFAIFIIFKFNITVNLFIIFLISLIRLNDQLSYGASHSGYRSFLDCIYSFYWGMLFCHFYIICNKKKFYNSFKNVISLFLLIVTYFAITELKNNNLLALPIIFSLLIFFSCDLNENSYLGKILCNRFCVYLGNISYSIYMSHLFIFWSVNNILKFFFKVDTYTDNNGIIALDLNLMEANILVIACYMLTIIVSALLYKHIEKRFYNS